MTVTRFGVPAGTDIWFDHCMARGSGGSGFKRCWVATITRTVSQPGHHVQRLRPSTQARSTYLQELPLPQFSVRMMLSSSTLGRLTVWPAWPDSGGGYPPGVAHVTVVAPKIMDTHKFAIHIDESVGTGRGYSRTCTFYPFRARHLFAESGRGVQDMRFQGRWSRCTTATAQASTRAGTRPRRTPGTWHSAGQAGSPFLSSTRASFPDSRVFGDGPGVVHG